MGTLSYYQVLTRMYEGTLLGCLAKNPAELFTLLASNIRFRQIANGGAKLGHGSGLSWCGRRKSRPPISLL